MEPGEEDRVCNLVKEVFGEFVAPLYEPEGVEEFLRYVDPDLMAQRSKQNHLTLLAEESGGVVGVIELRDFNHVSLLFVAGEVQRKGIARQLLNEGLETARRNRGDLNEVSVHSSPNAVEAYERLGFEAEGPEKLEHGIRYIPMKLRLADHDDG
jgi:GNAT superfamily N-acetyltransferase